MSKHSKHTPDTETEQSSLGNDVTTEFLDKQSKISSYIGSLLGHSQGTNDAEDLTQEVYIRAYSSKRDTKLEYPQAYLYRIAKNLVTKHRMKKASSLKTIVEDFVLDGVIDNIVPQDDALHQRNRLKAFYGALENLPPQCRRALELRQLEGLSHKQIAAQMNISTSTVEKHLAKGLRLCAKYMNEAGYESGEVIAVDRLSQRSEKN